MVGVEVERLPAKDEGRVVFASPGGQVGQTGEGIGRARLGLQGPPEGRFGAIEVPPPGTDPGLEDDEVGVGRVLGEQGVEDGFAFVPSSRIGVGPGQEESDLGVLGISLESVEGQGNGLVVLAGPESLPDGVAVLAPDRGSRHRHQEDQAEPEGGRAPALASRVHGVRPAFAKPRFSIDPHSFLPFR